MPSIDSCALFLPLHCWNSEQALLLRQSSACDLQQALHHFGRRTRGGQRLSGSWLEAEARLVMLKMSTAAAGQTVEAPRVGRKAAPVMGRGVSPEKSLCLSRRLPGVDQTS